MSLYLEQSIELDDSSRLSVTYDSVASPSSFTISLTQEGLERDDDNTVEVSGIEIIKFYELLVKMRRILKQAEEEEITGESTSSQPDD